ncbi:MAG: peptidoglycan recognition protein family protein [Desmonostoc vinosum HA7617-LM4]|jgi:hypothetical protein|nr:peptidoglycan recognition protein family protein [Desmonostoc vinosum HA7617-LM4]
MKFTDWATRVMIISLMFAALILVLFLGKAAQLQNNPTASNSDITDWSPYPQTQLQPTQDKKSKTPRVTQSPSPTSQVLARYKTTQAFAQYRPNYEITSVHPSNYGERYFQDINGVPLNNQPIIVLHETSYSASSAINFFQAPHDDQDVQASYHTLVKIDGTVVYLVPPEKRAFGAANSVFDGPDGLETVKTNPDLPPSVNNFAYHVSLETPPDSYGNTSPQTHSGYTEAQYNSLAWLIAQSQIPEERITTHQKVDRSGQKVDPINFDFNKFLDLLNTYRKIKPMSILRK